MQQKDLDALIAADPQASGLLQGNSVTREEALMSNLFSFGAAVMRVLKDGRCSVLKPPPVSYTAGNSLVVCGPEIFPRALFPDTPPAKSRIATTLVTIYGHLEEELHTHTSHVVSTVVEGRGWLFTDTEKLWALPGDLVVIPRGVKHLFNCDEKQRMLIFAVEFSDQPIDHQKNFY